MLGWLVSRCLDIACLGIPLILRQEWNPMVKVISFVSKVYHVSKVYQSRHWYLCYTLRKHAYSNILKILPPKNENFQIKKSLIFLMFLLKSMFLSRNKKNNVYPSFTI